MVCEEKGVPYQLTLAYPNVPEVFAISPFGKIPVLRHGNVELCESRAIAGYLDSLKPGGDLFPSDPLLASTQ